MKLDFETYRNKVMGCWAGKNIGGVLGAPFEGKRGMPQVDFYAQDLTQGPPPNDDLDLQIVWLAAVERYGRNVDASILGEYWLSYVLPNWVEYGTGKANLRAGLIPPISGYLDNVYANSCGCFIRSEIWACLCPGHPELAARYAYEDAIVDHAGEGMYGEIFFAALQSAAFVVSDRDALIDIGLSYIPQDCAVARAVRCARECHAAGLSLKEARLRVHNTAPGTFGIQGRRLSQLPQQDNEGMELGAPGFDAPENVAFAIVGWLWGEGDFGQALCAANACGEDTDCTCATLGATLGIIMGAKALPERWTKPLDDKISTLCIDKTSGGVWVPGTVTELTERVLRVTPGFLGAQLCDVLAPGGYSIECREPGECACARTDDLLPSLGGLGTGRVLEARELCALGPDVIRRDFVAFSVRVDLMGSPFLDEDGHKRVRVTVINADEMRQQQWARLTLYLPEGVTAVGARQYVLPLNNLRGSKAEAEFELDASLYAAGRVDAIVDVALEGRHSYGCVKLVLMRR